ncbi:hypothetical protein SLS53_008975 [Cytospora paraplurivora]|uniref:Uncharacterized protein n=1 Tax=Cytospora paraplurivora TaxID=2898453 RepID=A0AAN9YBJ7_9PEZI
MNINAQSGSSFFAIPGEIREDIYAYYLTFHYGDFEFSSRPFATFCSEEGGDLSKPLPALMLSCKRAYNEMRSAVHEQAVLRACLFDHGRWIGFAVHGNLRVSRLRRLVLHVAMEHARWNTWIKFFDYVMGCAGELRELVVDWEPRTMQSSRSVGYLAQQESRMEGKFFEVIAGAPCLEAVRIHGEVPSHWRDRLEVMIANRQDRVVKVVCSKERWWREDREDTMAYLHQPPISTEMSETVEMPDYWTGY